MGKQLTWFELSALPVGAELETNQGFSNAGYYFPAGIQGFISSNSLNEIIACFDFAVTKGRVVDDAVRNKRLGNVFTLSGPDPHSIWEKASGFDLLAYPHHSDRITITQHVLKERDGIDF